MLKESYSIDEFSGLYDAQSSITHTPLVSPSKPLSDKRDLLTKAGDFVSRHNLPGSQIGDALGKNLYGLSRLFKGDFAGFEESANEVGDIGPKRLAGDAARSILLPASMAAPVPKTLPTMAAQFAAFGAGEGGAEALTEGKDIPHAAQEALISGGISGLAGGVFNLLGKGLAKAGPSALSFTSGVPKAAIEQAAKSPETAKRGMKMSLDQIHDEATSNLQTLYNDLGKEFDAGLKQVVAKTGQTKKGVTFDEKGFLKSASAMRTRLTEYGREFAREFRLGTKAAPEGIQIAFDKSPIVSPTEQRAVQETFRTISTWDDFSAKGLQDLAERVGKLRKFESGAKTETSAIISKIYNKITGAGGQASHGLISSFYPELAKLRTNFHQNRTVLDEIQNVLSATSEKPSQIQGAVSRLDKLFNENRETYLNVIKQLGERSGVDFLSLLAGTEFQKVLPGFIRGLGGGATVSVGASVLNPWLILLAPLFSPRAAGLIARNTKPAAKAAVPILRAATSQAAPKLKKEIEK